MSRISAEIGLPVLLNIGGDTDCLKQFFVFLDCWRNYTKYKLHYVLSENSSKSSTWTYLYSLNVAKSRFVGVAAINFNPQCKNILTMFSYFLTGSAVHGRMEHVMCKFQNRTGKGHNE